MMTRPRPAIALILAAVLAWVARGSLARSSLDPTQYTRHTLMHGGVERSYYMHVPPASSAQRPLPLLILLHGGGGSAAQALADYPLLPVADRAGFVLVAPNGTGPLAFERLLTWNCGFGFGTAQRRNVDDTGFIRALITHLTQSTHVDPRRVYLTGLSNGAIMCHFAAGANADLVAGIAPVVGTAGGRERDSGSLTWPQKPSRAVDVILFNGALDAHVPLEGGWQRKHADRAPRFLASAQETARFWVEANGCAPAPQITPLPAQQATRYTWSGGRDGTRVVLYVLHNQGHAWPGGRGARVVADVPSPLLDAAEVMWAFFTSRTR